MDNSNRQMFPFDDALHVHQAGTVRPDNVFGLAVANGIIDKSGSWYSYGGSKLGQGAAGDCDTARPGTAEND